MQLSKLSAVACRVCMSATSTCLNVFSTSPEAVVYFLVFGYHTHSASVHVNACIVGLLVVVVVDEQVDGHFELCDAVQQFGLEFRLNRYEVILYLCRLHQTHRLLEQIYTCNLYISH